MSPRALSLPLISTPASASEGDKEIEHPAHTASGQPSPHSHPTSAAPGRVTHGQNSPRSEEGALRAGTPSRAFMSVGKWFWQLICHLLFLEITFQSSSSLWFSFMFFFFNKSVTDNESSRTGLQRVNSWYSITQTASTDIHSSNPSPTHNADCPTHVKRPKGGGSQGHPRQTAGRGRAWHHSPPAAPWRAALLPSANSSRRSWPPANLPLAPEVPWLCQPPSRKGLLPIESIFSTLNQVQLFKLKEQKTQTGISSAGLCHVDPHVFLNSC